MNDAILGTDVFSIFLNMKTDIPVYDITSFSEFRHEDILVVRLSEYWDTHKDVLHSFTSSQFLSYSSFKEGKGTHSIHFQTFPVKANQMYFMIPGRFITGILSAAQGYVISFLFPFFSCLIKA